MITLPFQFRQFDAAHYLLVNECGDFLFIKNEDFRKIVNNELEKKGELYYRLKSGHFICTSNLADNVEMISTKYRTRKRFISDFTALHMMVLTLRCTNNCSYCQVAAEGEDAKDFDMNVATAKRIVDIIFESPGKILKIEFQGGEPTLNWDTLTKTVDYANRVAKKKNKIVEFVVCTNLVKIKDEHLSFYKKNRIDISTSLDGACYVHDKHRVLKSGIGTYNVFMKNLEKTRSALGRDAVNALMTTTRDNLHDLTGVIDEYINNGFTGIFLRSLNPYGFADDNMRDIGYTPSEFVEKYEEALNYIIEYNIKTGKVFVEYFASILLARILTPFSTGFVDLQSPSGAGISGVIYDHNGNVFPSDEARMLARMGDKRFLLGNVSNNSYEEIFGNDILREITSKSCVETMPYCATCAYQAYCGSDPVRNYLTTKDIVGKRPDNSFCSKNMLIFDLLFKKIKRNDHDEMDVFWSWISRKSISEIRGIEGRYEAN